MYALVDCNNFYVSCERVFNPTLLCKPVIVLSNNDGCIISRSNEAKKLGIPMGAPFYKWRRFCANYQVYVFSSNFELYGDMSQRVMGLLKEFSADVEIYSIDEAFLFFKKFPTLKEMLILKNKIKQGTGIPISIGISVTKTLAKVANHLAKHSTTENIFYLFPTTKKHLATFPVEKIWGIGTRLAFKLKKIGIYTAQALQEIDRNILRLHFNVSVEKTVLELQGIACLRLEQPEPRKQIVSSSSFGKIVVELTELEEAISHYVTKAAIKLRKQKSVAGAVYVFLQTNIFSKQPQYGNGVVFPIPIPTEDTCYLIRIAKKCVKHLYKKNYQYHKAGVILLDLSPKKVKQLDLFASEEEIKRSVCLMQTMDCINRKWGKNTLFVAAEGISRFWQAKKEKISSRYTTRWQELPIVI